MSAQAAAETSPRPRWVRALAALRRRKMFAMLVLAFAAGIPYGAVLGTLNAWLTAESVKPSTVGILNFIILAYSFKLIWAPAFQRAWFPRIAPSFLLGFGARRSWLLAMQLIIAALLGFLALSRPAEGVGYLALLTVVIAIASSVHDIVLDAWRIEIAETEEDKDLMSAVFQFGYRFAGLFTGMFALILADMIPWSAVYLIIAVGMAVAATGTLVAREPDHAAVLAGPGGVRPSFAPAFRPSTVTASVGLVAAGWATAIAIIVIFVVQSLTLDPPPSAALFTRVQAPIIVALLILLPGAVAALLLRRGPVASTEAGAGTGLVSKASRALFRTILDPLLDLVKRLKWAAILVLMLVLMYRFVDLIWGGFAYPFYLGENFGALGHSNSDVAIASKTVGVLMTVAGSMIGGAALIFLGRMPCLVIGAFASAVTNLLFADLANGAIGMDAFLALTGLDHALASMGADQRLARLIMAIAGENLAGGFASVAFVAYLTAMVNPKFAAVQYTLLGSLVMLIGSLGRAELGVYIETDGFHDFFIVTFWLGLIAVVLSVVEWARHALDRRKAEATQGAVGQPAAAEVPAE
ncbi:beta-lactamase induction signal transducer [bacterium]|nr:beta-lactamase induction signal transducer [bacterium]